MGEFAHPTLSSSIFLTFSGNCKSALTFYQNCFGGQLHLDLFDNVVNDFPEQLVLSGYLLADSIIIRGSDLPYDQGRIVGNYMSIYLQCSNFLERGLLKNKLLFGSDKKYPVDHSQTKLIEVIDQFQVRWILGV